MRVIYFVPGVRRRLIRSYFHRDRKTDCACRLIGRFLWRFHYGHRHLACSLAIKLHGKYIFRNKGEKGEGKITKPITDNHEHTKSPERVDI